MVIVELLCTLMTGLAGNDEDSNSLWRTRIFKCSCAQRRTLVVRRWDQLTSWTSLYRRSGLVETMLPMLESSFSSSKGVFIASINKGLVCYMLYFSIAPRITLVEGIPRPCTGHWDFWEGLEPDNQVVHLIRNLSPTEGGFTFQLTMRRKRQVVNLV